MTRHSLPGHPLPLEPFPNSSHPEWFLDIDQRRHIYARLLDAFKPDHEKADFFLQAVDSDCKEYAAALETNSARSDAERRHDNYVYDLWAKFDWHRLDQALTALINGHNEWNHFSSRVSVPSALDLLKWRQGVRAMRDDQRDIYPKRRGAPPKHEARTIFIRQLHGYHRNSGVSLKHFEETIALLIEYVGDREPKDLRCTILEALGKRNRTRKKSKGKKTKAK